VINPAYSPTSSAARSSALMQDLRATMMDLQRQLSTGQKAATYGGLGPDRFTALNLQARLSQMTGYSNVIQSSSLRLTLMDKSMSGLNDIVKNAQSAATSATYEPNAAGRTIAQVSADDQLKMMIDLMNTDSAGQYLFSGRATDVKPVAGYDEMINGAAGKAGLKQMIAERQAADLGTGGLGRLTPPSLSGTTVTLERDAANPGPFGFTISSATTSSASISLSGPTGPQQTTTVGFTAQPADGDSVSLSLTLPDGSTKTITLTASSDTPAATGSFAIGATTAATAANFQSALQSELASASKTSLTAASSLTASKAFFAGSPSSPPMRVPSPAAAATGLVAGTDADTVIWYRGDDDTTAYPNARTTAVAKVGDALSVGVGARANEQAVQQSFAMLAALSLTDVAPSDPDGKTRYAELANRVRQGLSFPDGMQSITGMSAELASANAAIKTAKDRMTASKNVLTNSLGDISTADPQETTAALLALQTRLQATYATTAALSRLSLVNYLS